MSTHSAAQTIAETMVKKSNALDVYSTDYSDKYLALEDAFVKSLFAECGTGILDIDERVYSEAYSISHSSGWYEIASTFADLIVFTKDILKLAS